MQDNDFSKSQITQEKISLRVGSILFSADGCVQSYDRTAEQLLGYPAQKLVGQLSSVLMGQTIRPDGSKFLPENYPPTVALTSGQPYRNVIMGFYQPDGEFVWLYVDATPLFQSDEPTPYAVITTLREPSPAVSQAPYDPDEQRFRRLADSMPHIVFAARPDGNITYANQFAREFTGLDAELLKNGWVTCVHPDDRQAVFSTWIQAVQIGESYEMECRFRKADGTYRWLLNRGLPVKDQGGTIVEWVGSSVDIHERKQAEAALQKSEARFRMLADNIAQFAWMTDAKGWTFWYNQRWFDYTGTTLEEMQGWGWQTVHHPDHVKRVVEHMRHCFATGEVWEDTFPLRSREGEYRWFLSRAMPIRDEQGNVVCWFGTNTDITDRKRLEAELRQKNAILNVINESSPIPIFVKDRQGVIIYANPATLSALGKSEAEVIGQRDSDLYPNWDNAAKVMANDQRIMASGQAEVVEESPDGIRTFLGTKAPYRNERGEVIGLIGISNDISDRVQLERDREHLLQQEQAARETAEKANRIKDEFLAVVSHELRTPLNPILGWSKLLQKGKLDSTKTAIALSTIARNAQLQSQLIDDLLDISRILRGKLSLNTVSVDLETVVTAALETVRLAAEAKSLHTEINLSSSCMVMGDAGRLQQVVWNLLSNAVKFTPQDGQITVALAQVGGFAQVQVSDTGKGIHPDFLLHVFDHFRQEDSATTRKFGGLGLGLAIARQIVELHGGTIAVTSAGEGQGATFTVKFPLALSSPPELPSEPALVPTLNLDSVRILVVDDELDSRDFVVFVLEQAGAIVTSVASGVAALAKVKQTSFDLIVSDIGMPNMDGYMLLQEIRALEQGQDMPAIALTAYAGELDRQEALKAGFQEHLSKPIDPNKLIQTINLLLVKH